MEPEELIAMANRERWVGMTEWRVLESGVLAVKTPLEVASAKTGERRAIWFDPLKKRLVCSHVL